MYLPVWHKQWTNSTAINNSYEIDNKGNHVFLADLQGVYDFDPSPSTYSFSTSGSIKNGVIYKLDSIGNFIWALKFTSTNDCYVRDLNVDDNDNYYFILTYKGTVDVDPGLGIVNITKVSNTAGTEDAIVKISKNGNYAWHIRLSNNSYCMYIKKLGIDNSNKLLINAFTDGTIDLDLSASTYTVPVGNFLARYDTLANFYLGKSLGISPTSPQLGNFNFDGDNNIVFLGGYTNSSVDYDLGPATSTLSVLGTNSNYFVLKTDSAFNYQWVNAFHSSSSVSDTKVLIDSLKNTFICGATSSYTFYPQYNNTTSVYSTGTNSFKVFCIKYNSSGLYDKDLFLVKPRPFQFDLDRFGNFYFTGWLDASTVDFDIGPSVFNLTGKIQSDALMVTYDNNFNLRSGYVYTNIGSLDYFQSGYFIKGRGNYIYLVTNQLMNVDYAPSASSYLVNTGTASGYVLIKFNNGISTNLESNFTNKKFECYPNPNNGSFVFKIDDEIKDGELVIINSLGQEVHKQRIYKGNNNINQEEFSTGLYHYTLLQNKNKIGTGKFVIQ